MGDGLISELSTALGVRGQLDRTKSLAELGGDSFTAMIFQNGIKQRYAIKVPLAAITTELPLSVLLDQLVASIAGTVADTRCADKRGVA